MLNEVLMAAVGYVERRYSIRKALSTWHVGDCNFCERERAACPAPDFKEHK
jgi:hypothetical protein